jgi:hypothetical protein
MKKRLFYILIACALLNSCKKNELPKIEQNEEPVFYFTCNVNGAPMRIDAGINNYVMSSSHYQDNNNLYVFKGELKQIGCTNNCGYSLSILINDSKISEFNAATNGDSALTLGKHGFSVGSISSLSYRGLFLSTDDTIFSPEYNWTFSNSMKQQQTKQASMLFDAGEKVQVKLQYTDGSGCSASLTKDFKVGNPLQVNILAKKESSGAIKFSTNLPAGNSYKYDWNFGDNTTATDPAPLHVFPVSLPLDFITSLTVTTLQGDTCISYYKVKPDYDCKANFTSSFLPLLNPKLASTITVFLTDQNGVAHSSAEMVQPITSKFEIISVTNYMNNERNEATKKIKIRFNCSFNGSSGPLNISDGEAVLAVSYK